MAKKATWVDLVDPKREDLEQNLPKQLRASAIKQLLAPAAHDDEPRPTLQAHGDYVFGVFLIAVAVPEEDRVFYQEIDVVVSEDFLLTARKTPPGEEPYDISRVKAVCPPGEEPVAGLILYHLVDDVAERYLDLIDALNDEIDELEDHVELWPNEKVRTRLSDLRHDLLHIRRTLAPTRDAIRRIVDGRLEVEGMKELFPREVEVQFADVYDKLLRSSEGLELSRDLVASARDYHQAKISNDQNEVMKKLTAIASILLLPTFIVGLYGQNFRRIPELHWWFGYWWSWGWIIVTTIIQVVYFRRKGWI
jgi:magnesium transporter